MLLPKRGEIKLLLFQEHTDRNPECSGLALTLLCQHLKLDPPSVLGCVLQGIVGLAAACIINHAELISLAQTSKQ